MKSSPRGNVSPFQGWKRAACVPIPPASHRKCPTSSVKDVHRWWLAQRSKLNLTNPESHLRREDLLLLFSTMSTYLVLLITHRSRRVERLPKRGQLKCSLIDDRLRGLGHSQPPLTVLCLLPPSSSGVMGHSRKGAQIRERVYSLEMLSLVKFGKQTENKTTIQHLFCPLRGIYFSAMTSLILCKDLRFPKSESQQMRTEWWSLKCYETEKDPTIANIVVLIVPIVLA